MWGVVVPTKARRGHPLTEQPGPDHRPGFFARGIRVHRDFIIDGTGRVARVGDRVIITPLTFNSDTGPGVVTEIVSEDAIRVRFDSGPESVALATRASREDDTERSNERPL